MNVSLQPLLVRNLLPTVTHLPSRAHPGDAGMDLRYAGPEPVTLTPACQALVATGIAVAVPKHHVGLICPRSGLAARHGVTVVNAPGIIDHGYTGEIKVCLGLIGTSNTYTIHPGDRIAQLVLTPILVQIMESSFAEHAPENYLETEVAVPPPHGNGRKYVMIFARSKGQTPHQLRQAAEHELADAHTEIEQLRADNERLRNQLAHQSAALEGT